MTDTTTQPLIGCVQHDCDKCKERAHVGANQPPYGSKRAAAMAIYTPPFTYQHGYIFDSQRHMVADNGPICDGPSVEGAVVSRVRGWGRIGYMPNAAELQDEVGKMMADALNALYQVPPSNAGDKRGA